MWTFLSAQRLKDYQLKIGITLICRTPYVEVIDHVPCLSSISSPLILTLSQFPTSLVAINYNFLTRVYLTRTSGRKFNAWIWICKHLKSSQPRGTFILCKCVMYPPACAPCAVVGIHVVSTIYLHFQSKFASTIHANANQCVVSLYYRPLIIHFDSVSRLDTGQSSFFDFQAADRRALHVQVLSRKENFHL